MNTTMWKYTGQSVIGTSHEKMGIPCQDAHRIEVIDDLLVVVVADGAGSAKHAEIGAKFIAAETILLIRQWTSFHDDAKDWEAHLSGLVDTLRAQLETKADEMKCSVRDVAATFLLVIVAESSIAGLQIGDGAIIYGKQNEAEVELLITPERGEYLNETVFLTSPNCSFQFAYHDVVADRVAVMSDGLQLIALDLKIDPPTPYQTFFRPFFESLDTVEDNAERERHLQEFLQSPRVCSRTDDDKTIVFASRQQRPEFRM